MDVQHIISLLRKLVGNTTTTTIYLYPERTGIITIYIVGRLYWALMNPLAPVSVLDGDKAGLVCQTDKLPVIHIC